jgi:hypothetical protein
VTNPPALAAASPVPTGFALTKTLGQPATLTGLAFKGNFDRYSQESANANALQANSYLALARNGTTVFRGYALNKTDAMVGAARSSSVEATDLYGAFNWLLALGPGHARSYVVSSSLASVSNEPLYPLHSSLPLKYFPGPASATRRNLGCALQNIGTGGITAGATDAPLATPNDECLPAAGLALVGAEVVCYDGADQTTLDTTNMYAHNLLRGCLGTTAASHSAGASFFELRFCGWAYAQPLVEASTDGGTTWTALDAGAYTVNYAEGSISFDADPTVTPPSPLAAPLTNLRITADYYDQADTSSVYCLGDPPGSRSGLLELWLSGAAAEGGPGLSGGDYEIDLDTVFIQRADYSQPQSLRQALDGALRDHAQGLIGKHNAEWRIYDVVAFVRHSDGKFIIKMLRQNPNNAPVFTGAAALVRRYALADCYGAVCLPYTQNGVAAAAWVKASNLDPASNPNDSSLLYDSAAYAKLWPAHSLQQPRVQLLPAIGESTPGAAATIARNALRQGWQKFEAREYDLSGYNAALPEVGDVVRMQDGYLGIVWSLALALDGGRETARLSVVDLTAGVAV